MVDGLGVGDVGSIVLRDRKHLSEEGLFVAAVGVNSLSGEIFGIDISSKGFMYSDEESAAIIEEAKNVLKNALSQMDLKGAADWTQAKAVMRKELKNLFFKRTRRNPMIIPVILEN